MSLIPYLTRIHFADRVLEDALPEEVDRLGLRRPLLLTDDCGAGADLADRVECALPVSCVPVRAAAGPPVEVLAMVWADHACDGVLALGGPLAMRQALALGVRVLAPLPSRHLPVIALPTTTAALGLPEVPLPAASTGRRNCPPLPAVVLCDPTLTVWAGPQVTAANGMDVIVHCIETYLSATWNPPADGMALDGLRRAATALERAVADGRDGDARREMLAAALNAGLAGQKGLGATHALACALEPGQPPGTPHGWLHAALLPAVLRFNAPAVGDRYPALVEALRLPAGADLAAAVQAVGVRLGLPARLALDDPTCEKAAERAAEDPANRTNPRHATVRDYRAMLSEVVA